MKTKEITEFDDIIDSRDIIERIEYLEGTEDQEEIEELEALKDLAEQGEGYSPDWKYGETLIRDSYFRDYAMDLAEDIGAINHDAGWPNTCIDWDQAARDLQMDYSCITFKGVDYWIR